MKKLFVLLFTLLLISATVIGLTACETVDPVCQHTDTDGDDVCDECGGNLDDGKDEEPSESHMHEYDVKKAEADYLAVAADCKNAAKYYYSCSCGEKGSETFTYGEPCGHSYTERYTDSEYLAKKADCQSGPSYFFSCVCGEVGTETYVFGKALSHQYNVRNTDPEYLVSVATDYAAAKYAMSCKCGAKGSSTFNYGCSLKGELIYQISSDKSSYTVTGFSGFREQIVIPDTYEGLPVVAIESEAFKGNHAVKQVTLPAGIKRIGENAFLNCDGLEGVYITDLNAWCGITFAPGANPLTYAKKLYVNGAPLTDAVIPEGTAGIQSYLFAGCESLRSVSIPGSVTTIGESAFSGCTALESVSIPSGVTTIGQSAFSGCTALTEIVIPDSVVDLGSSAFSGCTALESVRLSENMSALNVDTFARCSSLATVTVPSGIKAIEYSAFASCSSLAEIKVDENNANFMGVDGILYSKDGKTLVLYAPGNEATSFTVPNGVTLIAAFAFMYTEHLEEVIISGSVRDMQRAFQYCKSIKTAVISNGVTEIGDSAFYNCANLTSVTLPDSVTHVRDFAFYSCKSLAGLNWPSQLKSIGSDAFASCKALETAILPESVTSVGGGAFRYCSSLESVYIPKGVYTVKSGSFEGCAKLKSVTISQGVARIEGNAFSGCTSIESLVIPKSLTDIDLTVFNEMTGLKHISVDPENPWFKSIDGVLYSIYGNILHLYPAAKSDESFTVPEKVVEIGNYAFRNNVTLRSLTISSNVTNIAPGALTGCTKLTDLTVPYVGETRNSSRSRGYLGSWFGVYDSTLHKYGVPPSLKNIVVTSAEFLDDRAFAECEYLESVTILQSSGFGNSTFMNCTNLKKVTIPRGVNYISDLLFFGCVNLTSFEVDELNAKFKAIDGNLYTKDGRTLVVYAKGKTETSFTIPDGVMAIEKNAFMGCTNLTEVIIPGTVTKIGVGAFSGCTVLKSVSIPGSVETVGYQAFYNCTALTSVTLNNGVKSIESYAFFGCTALKSVTIPISVTNVGIKAFDTYVSVAVDTDNAAYKVVDGNLYSKDGKRFIQYLSSKTEASFTVADGVEVIENGAFSKSANLKSIVIPKSVKQIKSEAFLDCTGLVGVYITDLAAWCEIDFGNASSNPLYYAKALYLNGELVEELIIPNGVTAITPFAFIGGESITEVVVHNGVTAIGKAAFAGCSGITGMTVPFIGDGTSGKNGIIGYWFDTSTNNISNLNTVPKSLETLIITGGEFIADSAFSYCTGLKSVTVPNTVAKISSSAFSRCVNLESVSLSEGLTSIGSNAFYGCSSLKNITIPSTVKSILQHAFGNCTGLESVILPEGLETLQYWAFSECTALKEVVIPGKVKVVTYSFSECYALEKITISEGVTEIDGSAFKDCPSLTTVIIPKSVTKIGSRIFDKTDSIVHIKYAGTKEMWDAIEKSTSWNTVYVDGEYVPMDCEITYNYTVE